MSAKTLNRRLFLLQRFLSKSIQNFQRQTRTNHTTAHG